jgi:hypothetical protein
MKNATNVRELNNTLCVPVGKLPARTICAGHPLIIIGPWWAIFDHVSTNPRPGNERGKNVSCRIATMARRFVAMPMRRLR